MVNLNVSLLNIDVQSISISLNSPLTKTNNSIPELVNFRDLLTDLLSKDNNMNLNKNSTDEIIETEKINIATKLINNSKLKNIVYKTATIFNLTNNTENIVTSDLKSLEKDPLINFILKNENLNTDEKEVFLKSLKFVSLELLNKQTTSFKLFINQNEQNLNQKKTSNISHFSLMSVDKSLNLSNTEPKTKENNILTEINNQIGDSKVKSNDTEVKFPQNINIQTSNFEDINFLPKLVQTQKIKNVNVNNINNDINIYENINEDKINIIPVDKNTKIIGNGIKVKENGSHIINDNFSDINVENKTNIANYNLNQIDTIKTKLHDIIGKIIQFYSEKDKNISENIVIDKKINNNDIKEIKQNFNELINNLEKINKYIIAGNIDVSNIVKNISPHAIVQNINNVVEKGERIILSAIKIHINIKNVSITFNGKENSSKDAEEYLIKGEKLINSLRDIINKIFVLLKELNGEARIYKKIEYVYKPNSNSTSQVNKDGVLLINTAKIHSIMLKIEDGIKIIKNDNINNNVNLTQNIKNNNFELNNNIRNTEDNFISEKFIKNDKYAKNNINIENNSKLENVNIQYLLYDKTINLKLNKDKIEVIPAKVFENIADKVKGEKTNIVLKQVAENIKNAVEIHTREKIEIHMSLRPENLGPVVIKLEHHKDNTIRGKISVLNADVKDILKANLVELKQTLQNLGLNVKDFDVSMLGQNLRDNGDSYNFSQNAYNNLGGNIIKENIEETIDMNDIYFRELSYLNYLV